MPSRYELMVVVAIMATGCAAANAQQNPAAPASAGSAPLVLDTVVVRPDANRDDRRESTANKITVSREDIARFGDANITDVLKRLPGVTVTGGAGRTLEVRMRGLGSGYTSILLNGDQTAPGFSIDSISPDLIDRIEVFRTATADKSAQAVAGTINIVLKQVVRQPQKDFKATVASERGRPSLNLSTQSADRTGAVSYVLGAAYRRDQYAYDGFISRLARDAQGQAVSDTRTHTHRDETVESITLTPRVNWNVNPRDTLSADGVLTYQALRGDGPEAYTTLLGAEPFIKTTEYGVTRDIGTVRGRLNWVRKLEDAAQLDVGLGASAIRRALLVTYGSLDADRTLQRLRSVDGPATDRSVTLTGKYRAPFVPGHALSVGWDGENTRRTEGRVQIDGTPTGVLTPVNLDEVFAASVRRLALFVQDEWEVSPRWSVYQGLRWEGIDTRTLNHELVPVNNRSRVLSPILQSVWKVPDTKSDQVRVGLSRTYKAPATIDLTPRRRVGATENTATSPDLEGNPSLRPELAWGLDLAYERYLADGGVLSGNVYVRRIRDVILQELFLDQSGLWISRSVNSGNAQTFGIELEAKGNVRKLFEAAPALDLRLNVARNWSKVDAVPGPHNRLVQQTPVTLNLGADWRPDGTPLTLGSNLGVITGGPVTSISHQSGGVSVKRQLDAYGLWKVDGKTQWRLSLTNLLHQVQRYDMSYDGGADGRLSQTSLYPSYTAIRLALELKL